MDYTFLKDIISELGVYQAIYGADATKEGFGKWLVAKEQESNLVLERDKIVEDFDGEPNAVDIQISYLVATMWKYGKHYIKQALDKLEINTPDEFSYLAALADGKLLSKTEVIKMNVSEIPSGMEVIKRLHKKGLIATTPNPNDGRAVLLKITPKGEQTMGQAFFTMQNAAKVIGGKLTATEKEQLLLLLNKLNNFHKDIYENHWNQELDELALKVV